MEVVEMPVNCRGKPIGVEGVPGACRKRNGFRHGTIRITIQSEFAALYAGAFCGNAVRSYAKNHEQAASVLRYAQEQSLNRESNAFVGKADASRGCPAVEQ